MPELQNAGTRQEAILRMSSTGRFIFDNESLGDIMETLSHWYDVDVVFDSPELRNLHFTGNMDRYGNLSSILKPISQTAELRIVLKNRTIYIYQ